VNPLYELALKQAENLAATAANISAVARETSDEAARWAFTQWSLRQRGAAKFALAEQMLFDRDGLEMATHEAVAAYHASLFPLRSSVVDLTAGIGADLIGLCGWCFPIGVEMDAERANLARYNLAVHGHWPEIVVADALEVLASRAKYAAGYYFADPSRREGGKRTLDPSQFSPDPSVLAGFFRMSKLSVMKLSPMLPDSFLEPLGRGLEFVSFDGECREALVLNGTEANEGRWAVQAETGTRLAASPLVEVVEEPLEFVFEADPAAIRAHALGGFGLAGLGDSNGYLTGPSLVASSWLRAYRVLYAGRGDVRATKAELARLDSATPVVKQRGAGQDVDQLRKQLRFSGSRPLVLMLYPVGKSVRHILAEVVV